MSLLIFWLLTLSICDQVVLKSLTIIVDVLFFYVYQLDKTATYVFPYWASCSWATCTCGFVSVINSREFEAIISTNIFSVSFFFFWHLLCICYIFLNGPMFYISLHFNIFLFCISVWEGSIVLSSNSIFPSSASTLLMGAAKLFHFCVLIYSINCYAFLEFPFLFTLPIYSFMFSSVPTGAFNILIIVILNSASHTLIFMPYQSLLLMLALFPQIVIFLAVLHTLWLVVEGQTYFIG